jgi:hypothetical protein
LAAVLLPARTIGVVTMSRGLDAAAARASRRELSSSLGLPVFAATDGLGGLADLVLG